MKIREHLRALRTRLGPAPLIEIGISRANLLGNLATYRAAYPHLAFAPVLKSNAYGHGLLEVARILDREPIAFFMTDSWHEARELRRGGVKSRIVVMGYVRPETVAASRLKCIDCAIVDLEELRALVRLVRRPLRLHLKIDTGMHRQGLGPHELPKAAKLVAENRHLSVAGLCSHFADADTADSPLTAKQLAAWREASREAERLFPGLDYRHFAATAAVGQVPPELGNVARLGIGLYGFDRIEGSALPLRPVLELRSSIVSLRQIAKGEAVGYNGTYLAKDRATIATVPLGYFEGVDRRLSNRGAMLVRDRQVPIAGRVSMNMCSLDVTSIPDVERGDTVIAISRDRTAPNSVPALARMIETNLHEILIHIPAHLRRVVE